MCSNPPIGRSIVARLLIAIVLATSVTLAACGETSPTASSAPTATAIVCTVPTDGKTAFTSLDGAYKVTVPKGWSATCFNAAPFSNGIRAIAPDGQYAVYILPARPTKIPSGSNGLQLFVQNQGPAFLTNQLKPDSVTPCCADLVTFGKTNGVDVQFDLFTGGVTSEAEFLTVAHDDSPFVILGHFPSTAGGVEDEQLQTMIFSSFTFL